jgi:hypothetical protein
VNKGKSPETDPVWIAVLAALVVAVLCAALVLGQVL